MPQDSCKQEVREIRHAASTAGSLPRRKQDHKQMVRMGYGNVRHIKENCFACRHHVPQGLDSGISLGSLVLVLSPGLARVNTDKSDLLYIRTDDADSSTMYQFGQVRS